MAQKSQVVNLFDYCPIPDFLFRNGCFLVSEFVGFCFLLRKGVVIETCIFKKTKMLKQEFELNLEFNNLIISMS